MFNQKSLVITEFRNSADNKLCKRQKGVQNNRCVILELLTPLGEISFKLICNESTRKIEGGLEIIVLKGVF